jgi:hypothetical protein
MIATQAFSFPARSRGWRGLLFAIAISRLEGETVRDDAEAFVVGFLLIMGVLDTLNVVAVAVIGGLLSNNKRLEQRSTDTPSPAGGAGGVPPLGPGTWILRVEQAPTTIPTPPGDPTSRT